jgi:hypothetical protein
MANFDNAFKDFQSLKNYYRERSETYHILNDGKNINIGQEIKNQTVKLNLIQRNERTMK